MKKSMPQYITVLSESGFDILEDIFINKFNKFSILYWAIRDFSNMITSLTYDGKNVDELNISMTVSSKKELKKIVETIEESLDDLVDLDRDPDCDIEIKIKNNKVINIVIKNVNEPGIF